MAIDNAEKRKSISGIHQYASGPGVTNLAAEDQEWRQEVGYSYNGILAAAPAGAGQPTMGRWALIRWMRLGEPVQLPIRW